MRLPNRARRQEIDKLPSTWSDIDFSTFPDNEKLYWFQHRRVEPWLLKDTKAIKEKAESMFGLIAMVCIGVEFISKFRYGKDEPNVYFPLFLEEYLDVGFKKQITNTYNPNPTPSPYEKWFYKKPKLKYSEIFYFGMRNQLTHRFLLRHAVLIEPMPRFLTWERAKRRLLVDSRFLHINFDNGIRKYLSQVWKSTPGNSIYQNFFLMFADNFERKY